jgi:hypothetical protein
VTGHRGIALAAAIVFAAVAIVLLTGMRPEFDAYGWLVWGHQALHWTLDTNGAPSWKPLPFLFTVPYALFGRGQLWLWMVTAVAAALAGAVFAARIAYHLTSGEQPRARYIAGAFAGIGVLGLGRYWHFILIANSDPMIVALCLAAVDFGLRDRLVPAYALLVLAALGRPEVWPFAALFTIWTWRARAAMRPMLAAGAIVIAALWFGVPALTSRSALIAGDLAENFTGAVHGPKIPGVVDRFISLYPWPMWVAALAGVALAAARRDRAVLALAGAAVLWVAVEIAFAYNGWGALARYMFEAGAAAAVIAATAVGRVLASRPGGGPAIVLALVIALVPAARSTARFVHGEVSYGRLFARQVNRLADVIDRDGGAAVVRRCGLPVSSLEFQSVLAWEVGLNVGDIGWKPASALRSGRPIVLFAPTGWGWVVRPMHTRGAGCSRLFARTPVGSG